VPALPSRRVRLRRCDSTDKEWLMIRTTTRLLALVLSLMLLAAACGTGGDTTEPAAGGDTTGDTGDAGDDATTDDGDTAAGDDEAVTGEGGGDLIVGTTDTVVTLDPAKAYDYYSSNIIQNVAQTLVGFAPGETEPSPMLAEDWEVSDDGLTYTFTLREGVTFHNGKEMTSEDVQFSFERVQNMNHPAGAAFLLDGIASIETPDDLTVEITLSEPNATFVPRLGYTVATIVPSDGHYPAPDTEVEAGEEEGAQEQAAEEFVQEDLIGTGPYTLGEFREGESITLIANPDYWGDAPRNDRVLVRFFETSSQMKLALENGEIDVANRDFSPDEQQDLQANDAIQSVQGDGGRTRYIVINVTHDEVSEVDVRQAIAAAIDRDRIIEDVFAGQVEPIYSMIPPGFDASRPYFEEYDDADPSDFLDEADGPVSISLHYGGERYGPTEPSLVQVIERMLEETGLFEVDLVSTEWAQFTQEAWPGADGQYPVFMLGWNPDFFDPDTYIEPFYLSTGFLSMYENPEMDRLIVESQQETDPDAREELFDEIQRIAADDVPIIPLFQEVPWVYAQTNISGLEETMDEVMIFRYWLISKS
jgi:peptide/nickel transport system substrate-binding protein